jgi:hypothetical protein
MGPAVEDLAACWGRRKWCMKGGSFMGCLRVDLDDRGEH